LMRLKLTVLILFLIGVASALPAGAQDQDSIIKLDTRGGRGVVYFSHKGHEALINPDPNFVYKARVRPNAACSGCHHTQSSRGIPQLWKCVSCHKGEGNEKNPKNVDSDEVHAERAFHDMCIGCHRSNREQGITMKGPVSCGGCHKLEQ
jgi:hypothetical protein